MALVTSSSASPSCEVVEPGDNVVMFFEDGCGNFSWWCGLIVRMQRKAGKSRVNFAYAIQLSTAKEEDVQFICQWYVQSETERAQFTFSPEVKHTTAYNARFCLGPVDLVFVSEHRFQLADPGLLFGFDQALELTKGAQMGSEIQAPRPPKSVMKVSTRQKKRKQR